MIPGEFPELGSRGLARRRRCELASCDLRSLFTKEKVKEQRLPTSRGASGGALRVEADPCDGRLSVVGCDVVDSHVSSSWTKSFCLLDYNGMRIA